MTKETKIGLLVGLAFIILFAIILSEKGARPAGRGLPAPRWIGLAVPLLDAKGCPTRGARQASPARR